MRRFYVPANRFHQNVRFALDKEQTRHLRNVLRLRTGEEILVFDGEGKEFVCLVQEFSGDRKICYVRIVKEIPPRSPESELDLTLAVAVLKGDKFDLVIQKAVELGVRRFIPLITRRGDVKLRNEEKKLERWHKIIIEASKQCGRAGLMEMGQSIDFGELLEETEGEKIVFSERNGQSFAGTAKAVKKVTALIGPEGGWDDAELELAEKTSCRIITLGGRILRAETAGITIAAILQHRFGDLN